MTFPCKVILSVFNRCMLSNQKWNSPYRYITYRMACTNVNKQPVWVVSVSNETHVVEHTHTHTPHSISCAKNMRARVPKGRTAQQRACVRARVYARVCVYWFGELENGERNECGKIIFLLKVRGYEHVCRIHCSVLLFWRVCLNES